LPTLTPCRPPPRHTGPDPRPPPSGPGRQNRFIVPGASATRFQRWGEAWHGRGAEPTTTKHRRNEAASSGSSERQRNRGETKPSSPVRRLRRDPPGPAVLPKPPIRLRRARPPANPAMEALWKQASRLKEQVARQVSPSLSLLIAPHEFLDRSGWSALYAWAERAPTVPPWLFGDY
jgi:hypothetical protein